MTTLSRTAPIKIRQDNNDHRVHKSMDNAVVFLIETTINQTLIDVVLLLNHTKQGIIYPEIFPLTR